jgi:hypothetical protein
MEDGISCCWPGQALEGATCHGLPTACPRDAIPSGDDCVARPGAHVTVSTAEPHASYQVKLDTAAGGLSCDGEVTTFRVCELRGVTPGKARVSVRTEREARWLDLQGQPGTVAYEQDVPVSAPQTLFQVQHRDYAVELGTGVGALATLTLSLIAAAAPCKGYTQVSTQVGGGQGTYQVLQPSSSVCPGWLSAAVLSGVGTGVLGYFSLTRIGHHDEVVPVSDVSAAKGAAVSAPQVSWDGHTASVGATVTY